MGVKKDKDYIARAQGMEYALRIAKEKGIDGLERELKIRNLMGIPLNIPSNKLDGFLNEISMNLYNNFMCTIMYSLHDTFGFGKYRIKRLKDAIDKNVAYTLDYDYMGEHYVKLEDYAKEMNEKYNLGLDLERVNNCQQIADDKEEAYHMVRVEKCMDLLNEAGYTDAARFLESKIDIRSA